MRKKVYTFPKEHRRYIETVRFDCLCAHFRPEVLGVIIDPLSIFEPRDLRGGASSHITTNGNAPVIDRVFVEAVG